MIQSELAGNGKSGAEMCRRIWERKVKDEERKNRRVFIWSECIALDGNPGLLSFSNPVDYHICKDFDWLNAPESAVEEMARKLSIDCWDRHATEHHGKNVSVEVVEYSPDRPVQSLRFVQF